MITETEYVRNMLKIGGYSLVLCEGGRVYTSEEDCILPLWETVQAEENWKNAYAALKALGKAEAFLLIKLGVQSVYAETACKSALRLLEQHGINAAYKTAVANFLNQSKTGLSRTEAAVSATDNPEDALRALHTIL